MDRSTNARSKFAKDAEYDGAKLRWRRLDELHEGVSKGAVALVGVPILHQQQTFELLRVQMVNPGLEHAQR